MKRVFALLLAVLLLAALLTGCGQRVGTGDTSAETQTKPVETAAAKEAETKVPGTEAPDSEAQDSKAQDSEAISKTDAFVTINGTDVRIGDAYADFRDRLGTETAPAEELTACDPSSDWKQTRHFYTGVMVAEDKDGVICCFEITGPEALFAGSVKVGDPLDAFKAVLKETCTESEFGVFYDDGNPWICAYPDDDGKTIASITYMIME